MKSNNRRALSGMASTIVMRLARAATQAEKVVAIKAVTAKEPLISHPPKADDSVVCEQSISTKLWIWCKPGVAEIMLRYESLH